MSIVTIKEVKGVVACANDGTAEHVFNVKNATDKPLRVDMQLSIDEPVSAKWLQLEGSTEHELDVETMTQVSVKIQVPSDCAPGKYSYRLRVYDPNNPGDDYTDGDPVYFEVGEKKEKESPITGPKAPHKKRLALGIGAVALILVLSVVVWFLFSKPASYTITASSGPNGSILPTGKVVVAQGGRKSFEITPKPGYRIADVKVDDKSVGSKKSYPFNDVSINHTISASFKQRPPYERFTFNPQRRNLQIRSEFLSNPGRQITLEAWFKTEALGTRQAIITKLHPEFKKREPYYQFNLELRPAGQLYFALAIKGKRRWIDKAFSVYPNRWYHVAATYNGKIMRLYLNGKEWGKPYYKEGTLNDYGKPLVIGGEPSDRPFKGSLAEVRIWDVARTSEEIVAKMNETIPATEGLVFSSTNW